MAGKNNANIGFEKHHKKLTTGVYVFKNNMKCITSELKDTFEQSEHLQTEIKEKLKAIGWEM